MKKLLTKKNIIFLSIVLMAVVALSITYHYLGTVMISFEIQPRPVKMTPIVVEIPLGKIYARDLVTVEMADTGSDLIVNQTTDIAVNLTGDYQLFDTIDIIVILKSSSNTYNGWLNETYRTTIIENVAPGTYDIYLDYMLIPKDVDKPVNGTLDLDFYWLDK